MLYITVRTLGYLHSMYLHSHVIIVTIEQTCLLSVLLCLDCFCYCIMYVVGNLSL